MLSHSFSGAIRLTSFLWGKREPRQKKHCTELISRGCKEDYSTRPGGSPTFGECSYSWHVPYITSQFTISASTTTSCMSIQCRTFWFSLPFFLDCGECPSFWIFAISCRNSTPASSKSPKDRLAFAFCVSWNGFVRALPVT